MKVYALSNDEAARSGFTHKAILSYAQGDFSAAAVSQTYALHAIPAGSVLQNIARRLVTNLSGGAASAVTSQVGDGSTANLYLTAQSVLSGATPIAGQAADGAGFNQAGGAAINSATTLTATLTATGANISTLTAGEIHYYWKQVDLTKL
jgi:hypothetical protein